MGTTTRRGFLKGLGIGAGLPVVGGILAACTGATAGAPKTDSDHNLDEAPTATVKAGLTADA